MDLSKYRRHYISETQEHLDRVTVILLNLERQPDQMEHVSTVLRLFHSVKGMSGTMGYRPIYDLTHVIEDLLEVVAAGRLKPSAEVIDLMLTAIDRINRWISDVAEDRPVVGDEVSEALMAQFVVFRQAKWRPATPGPGAMPFASGDDDEMLFTGDLDLLDSGSLDITPATVPHDATPPQTPGAGSDGSMDESADFESATLMPFDAPPSSPVVLIGPPTRAPSTPPVGAAPAGTIRTQTLRIGTHWLDAVIDRVGGLRAVMHQLMALAPEVIATEGASLIDDLSRGLELLHTDAVSVRMVPLTILTQRLPRVIRDLCRESGKRASIEIRGDDERLDRAVMEAIDVPLTHILRNAVDHGLEYPERRRDIGKPSEGQLILVCRQEVDHLVVEVTDDGKGIDAETLAQRAVGMGLLTKAEAAHLVVTDLTALVCLPGLSSKSEVTTLAGRGIGMDVVAETMASFGGSLTLETRQGLGTTVRLSLPRTPGITEVVVVDVGDQRFAIPADDVLEHLSQAPAEAVDLGPLVDFPPATGPGAGVRVKTTAGEPVFRVDRIIGRQHVVLKPLDPLLARVGGLSGMALDLFGEPVFVLDIEGLLATAEGP